MCRFFWTGAGHFPWLKKKELCRSDTVHLYDPENYEFDSNIIRFNLLLRHPIAPPSLEVHFNGIWRVIAHFSEPQN